MDRFLKILLTKQQDQSTLDELATQAFCPDDDERFAKASFAHTDRGIELNVQVLSEGTREVEVNENWLFSVKRID